MSRLKWRSHFIQKFEVDNSYEYKCINSGYEKMNYKNNLDLIEKWKNGKTGFPLVDAFDINVLLKMDGLILE